MRKALQYLKNRKNMPEYKLREQDSDAAVEREERHILAVERVAAAMDAQVAATRGLAATLRELTDHQSAMFAEQANMTASYASLATSLARCVEIFETIVSIVLQLPVYVPANKRLRTRLHYTRKIRRMPIVIRTTRTICRWSRKARALG